MPDGSAAVSSETRLPLPVRLTPPEAGDAFLSSPELVKLQRLKEGAYYDVNTQTNISADGSLFIEAFSSRCNGICGTNIGGVIVSERDQVSDD